MSKRERSGGDIVPTKVKPFTHLVHNISTDKTRPCCLYTQTEQLSSFWEKEKRSII